MRNPPAWNAAAGAIILTLLGARPAVPDLLAPVAAATLPGRSELGRGQAADLNPFAFPPPGPTERFSAELLGAWVAAVVHHEPGVDDEHARTIAGWTSQLWQVFADLKAVRTALIQLRVASASYRQVDPTVVVKLPQWQGRVSALHALLQLTPDEAARSDVSRILARAAVLHTDIAVFDSLARGTADRMAVASVASRHFGVAMALVDLLAYDDENDALPRRWYLAVAAFLQKSRDVGSGPLFVNRAMLRNPGDADLLLMRGAIDEFLASPAVQDTLGLKYDPQLRQIVFNDERGYLRAAQGFERRAIERNPESVEARLRLGHVIGQLGDHEQALSELKAALAGAADKRLQYYAWLFTGQEHEALGRRDAARDAYQQALALYPGAQSGTIALGHLARRFGDRAGAAAAVQSVLSAGGEERYDPWDEYFDTGPGRQAQRMLEELRRSVRERRSE